jgi:hypothetical protein
MKRIRVEKYTSADFAEFADWTAKLAHRNNVDPDVFAYPTFQALKVSNGRGIAYVPFQVPWMLEALAFNPEATAQEKAVALREAFTVLEFEARCLGIREIYFLCADAETKAFVMHHDFEAMTACTGENPMQLFRRKI